MKNFYVRQPFLAIEHLHSNLTYVSLNQEIIITRLKILGFINIDWIEHLSEVRTIPIDEWKKGNLVIGDGSETVIDTAFEDIPKTWMMLYSGVNTGKLITKLKE